MDENNVNINRPADCFFCKVYDNQIGIIYENEHFYSRFDRYPISPGHAEVIPKKHIMSLLDLTNEEWIALKPAIAETKKIIESYPLKDMYREFSMELGHELEFLDKGMVWFEELLKNHGDDITREFSRKMLNHVGIDKKPDAYNFGNNDGLAAGRTVHHLHYHIIPRYFGDTKDQRFGIRWVIPELADYKK